MAALQFRRFRQISRCLPGYSSISLSIYVSCSHFHTAVFRFLYIYIYIYTGICTHYKHACELPYTNIHVCVMNEAEIYLVCDFIKLLIVVAFDD